ncbi:MAG: ABC transporter permease [Methanobacteriota archaeon]|nr:MAG: ABC transporter permease [Euryarchaeota archaeon]
MENKTIAEYGVRSLGLGRLRTLLAIVAIAIGAFSIAALTGLASGLQKEVTTSATSFGTQLVIIVPTQVSENIFVASQRQNFIPLKQKFTENDVKRVLHIQGVERATGLLAGLVEITYKNASKKANVVGIDKEYIDITPSLKINEGRWIEGSHDIVLGSSIAKTLFSEELQVNKKVEIEGELYRVVGILKESGNSLARIDDRVFIRKDTVRKLFPNRFEKNEVLTIAAKVRDGYDSEKVAKDIDNMLAITKRVGDKKTYTVITAKFIGEQIGKLTSMLEAFFIAVSAMALLVGIVGIANTVYMNIIDRRREIGLLKTLGVKNKEVVRLFVFEGVMLAIIGSVVGSFIGLVIGILQGIVPFEANLPLIIVATVILALAGAIASYLPARTTTSISPAEAMRYE